MSLSAEGPFIANNIQVGGNHYKTDYQHWDWSLDVECNPMQYQITKYLRARKKNGLQDMEKIKHFLMKYAEQLKAEKRYPPSRIPNHMIAAATTAWCKENGMDHLETQVALDIVLMPNVAVCYELMDVVDKMMELFRVSHALKDSGLAGPGYVDQG